MNQSFTATETISNKSILNTNCDGDPNCGIESPLPHDLIEFFQNDSNRLWYGHISKFGDRLEQIALTSQLHLPAIFLHFDLIDSTYGYDGFSSDHCRESCCV